MSRPKFFAPEVLQTSSMDCGPAALKSILEGLGIQASYGRLREACHTRVSGTSINDIEDFVVGLGIKAEQVMVPAEHLWHRASPHERALVVTRLPSGAAHFVVLWTFLGPWVQVMDPAKGRRWLKRAAFESELFHHELNVATDDWRDWSGGDEFRAVLEHRLASLNIAEPSRSELLAGAAFDSWLGTAALDAAVRLVHFVGERERRSSGEDNRRLLDALIQSEMSGQRVIPKRFWSVGPEPLPADESCSLQVPMRGVVMLRFPEGANDVVESAGIDSAPHLRALQEEASERKPLGELLRPLHEVERLVKALLLIALLGVTVGTVLEVVLYRGFLTSSAVLSLEQRAMFCTMVLGLAVLILALEVPLTSAMLHLGRRVEVEFQRRIRTKLPRLGDRYFHSRLVSDMAERCHSIFRLRTFGPQLAQTVRLLMQVVLLGVAVVLLSGGNWWAVVLLTGTAILLPLLVSRLLKEAEIRRRTLGGSLSRFYLDALAGGRAVRAHGANDTINREHERLLVDWVRAGYRFASTAALMESFQLAVGFGLTVLLVVLASQTTNSVANLLLLAYWALAISTIGRQLSAQSSQYQRLFGIVRRLIEPITAQEEEPERSSQPGERSLQQPEQELAGVSIQLERVSVVVSGRTLLKSVSLSVAPGESLAVVGRSGAGKSTFISVLLGFHRAASGAAYVDGAPLDQEAISRLRRETVWIDPTIFLFNRSLRENLTYGRIGGITAGAMAEDVVTESSLSSRGADLVAALRDSGLDSVVERLPEGLATKLRSHGSRLSGGETQRVRVARGLAAPVQSVRLVVLDEAFRGLEKTLRERTLARIRERYPSATLVCVTHDLELARSLGRVVLFDGGQLVQDVRLSEGDGPPAGSLLQELEADAEAVGRTLWQSSAWRHMKVDGGLLTSDESS